VSLRNLVETQVSAAFDLLGDLKQTIVFSTTTNRDYNFATGEVSESSTDITLEGVIESITINEDRSSSNIIEELSVKFIVNKADLGDSYNQFDSFTADGRTYKILEFTDNGYSVEGIGVGG